MEVDTILAYASAPEYVATITDIEKRKAFAAHLVTRGQIPHPSQILLGPAHGSLQGSQMVHRPGHQPPQACGRGN